MLALDTNILVRLVTNDDPKAAQRVQEALDAELAAERECMVGHIVLCELIWVLQRLYGYNLQQCQQTLGSLLGFAGLQFEELPVVLSAYKAWKKHGGDWADHLIGAQMKSLGCDMVLTLDKAASRAATHRMV
jgi:predicted nucleic-acid-binding protein